MMPLRLSGTAMSFFVAGVFAHVRTHMNTYTRMRSRTDKHARVRVHTRTHTYTNTHTICDEVKVV